MDRAELERLAASAVPVEGDFYFYHDNKPTSKKWKRPSGQKVYRCANCDADIPPGRRRVYCSPACDAEADVVRFVRTKHAEYGRTLPPDIERAIRMRGAHALGGGYDEVARYIPKATRVFIRQRDRDHCVLCGRAGEHIDHINGPSRDPGNLRLLCADCNMSRAEGRSCPIEPGSPQERKRDEMLERIDAPEPLRPCDAPAWDWRRWVFEQVRPT